MSDDRLVPVNSVGSNPPHYQDVAAQKYEAAIAALNKGELNSAKTLLQESAAAAVHYKTFERLGEIARQQGNLAEAAVMLGAAVGIGVNQARPRLLLAEVLRARGEPYVAAMKLRMASPVGILRRYLMS